MSFIVINTNSRPSYSGNGDFVKNALSKNPLDIITLQGLSAKPPFEKSKAVFALPEEWKSDTELFFNGDGGYPGKIKNSLDVLYHNGNLQIPGSLFKKSKSNKWTTIKNGSFATQIDFELVSEILNTGSADVVIINTKPDLKAHLEKVKLTDENKVAGFRRLYYDNVEPDFNLNTLYSSSSGISDSINNASSPCWPEYTFVKTEVMSNIFRDRGLPMSFIEFLEKCRSSELEMQAFNIGGNTLNLQTKEGFLSFYKLILNNRAEISRWTKLSHKKLRTENGISPDARLIGKVITGRNVTLEPGVVIVGPSVICDNTCIKKNTVINSSVIGSDISIPKEQIITDSIIWDVKKGRDKISYYPAPEIKQAASFLQEPNVYPEKDNKTVFQSWSFFSYPGSIKRLCDFLAAAVILVLLAPVFPFICLAVKLNSRGPVIYKDKRQGLGGKEFNCFKFRSMRSDACQLQDKLRVANQIDGPQFKIDDDPRITTVGRFLRDTYLDELPQFINVLLGQMSIIGPRPSPEQENNLCPCWRNARLSTRPGITGLWQVCRTRKPGRDFQEWIYYDIKYVRNLSLKLDMWIFWQTTKKLIKKFIDQL